MIFQELSAIETRFRQTGQGGEYALRPIAIPVPGESLTLNGLLCTPNHRSGYYHDSVYPKERIVLHFTAGSLPSDMGALTRQDYHVSVPFVIARDGTIYQLYSSRFWSGNLGGDAVGNHDTGNDQDKRTIGIEISNHGPLTVQSDNLATFYDGLYCPLTQSVAYQKLTEPFRGETYFATFTPQQYNSLTVLLRYLTAQYAIPRKFLPKAKRFVTRTDVLTFRGIVSHVNYRASGKWDIGPAFNWARLIRDVQAPVFAQPQNQSFDGFNQPILSSEEALIPLLPKPRPAVYENEPYDEME